MTTSADSIKSPKTGGSKELKDADLLDCDNDDTISTVPELGAEEDLENPESQLSELIPMEEQTNPKRNTDPPSGS